MILVEYLPNYLRNSEMVVSLLLKLVDRCTLCERLYPHGALGFKLFSSVNECCFL